MEDTLTGLFQNSSDDDWWCFDFKQCTFQYVSCRMTSHATRVAVVPGLMCWNAVFFRCLASVTTTVLRLPPPQSACNESVRPYLRYTAASAAWVLLCSIIVFFMVSGEGGRWREREGDDHVPYSPQKAGFMLVELAFARTVKERRHVVILVHL